ncbi:hypothetical protein DY000_02036348 [Brassica cretica]|uniref:Uncharacterized protein n=1 Tax=Brassica cretica TaxID=69181 RepID=A0ABQ7BAJ7_BRACR|nr:hypothetical protein DY000_02036348 [Brassica cretica]
MIDFKKDMGNSPYDDTNAYYHYIKKSISIEDLMGWLLSPTACRKREIRREVEKRACHAIGLIGVTRQCRGLLVEARVVPALVDLFRDGDEKGKILAGNALEIIAAQPEYIRLVTEAGSIPLYVELLSGGDSMGKDIAEDVFSFQPPAFSALLSPHPRPPPPPQTPGPPSLPTPLENPRPNILPEIRLPPHRRDLLLLTRNRMFHGPKRRPSIKPPLFPNRKQQEPEYYTDVTIKGLMLGMMIAGTDTSAVTLEWAMSCLLNHPESMEKAKHEINEKIGQDRLIDEPDLANLPYLQNIVSETFRLYPAAPLLVPRSPMEDIKVGGYDVPRGTMVMVNAWAIHRDPSLWSEPEKFKPERFNSGGEDVHKLMPFGNGRRSCPGAGLGQRIVTLALGSLIQCFDWEKVNGEKIDMTETPGMAMRKKEPLRALCRSRPIMNKLQAHLECA